VHDHPAVRTATITESMAAWQSHACRRQLNTDQSAASWFLGAVAILFDRWRSFASCGIFAGNADPAPISVLLKRPHFVADLALACDHSSSLRHKRLPRIDVRRSTDSPRCTGYGADRIYCMWRWESAQLYAPGEVGDVVRMHLHRRQPEGAAATTGRGACGGPRSNQPQMITSGLGCTDT
jgi:hypothetical protein